MRMERNNEDGYRGGEGGKEGRKERSPVLIPAFRRNESTSRSE